FEPKTAYEYGEAVRANTSGGHKQFVSPSPQYGAEIVYRLTSGDRRTQTKVVIRDVRGDTVRTVNGPGGPGLHRATWGFQGRTPPPQTLSPSQRRDSTLIVRRIQLVFDSLEKAGTNAQMLGPLKTALLAGDLQGLAQRFGFGGGGGGGGGGGAVTLSAARFVERPGETTPRAPGATAGPAAQQQEGGESGAEQPDVGFLGTLGQLIRVALPSQRGPGGGGGGGGGLGGLGCIAQAFGRTAGAGAEDSAGSAVARPPSRAATTS